MSEVAAEYEQFVDKNTMLSPSDLFGQIGTRDLTLHFLSYDYDQELYTESIEQVAVKVYTDSQREEVADFSDFSDELAELAQFWHYGLSTDLSNGGVLNMTGGAFDEYGLYYLGHHRVWFSKPEAV